MGIASSRCVLFFLSCLLSKGHANSAQSYITDVSSNCSSDKSSIVDSDDEDRTTKLPPSPPINIPSPNRSGLKNVPYCGGLPPLCRDTLAFNGFLYFQRNRHFLQEPQREPSAKRHRCTGLACAHCDEHLFRTIYGCDPAPDPNGEQYKNDQEANEITRKLFAERRRAAQGSWKGDDISMEIGEFKDPPKMSGTLEKWWQETGYKSHSTRTEEMNNPKRDVSNPTSRRAVGSTPPAKPFGSSKRPLDGLPLKEQRSSKPLLDNMSTLNGLNRPVSSLKYGAVGPKRPQKKLQPLIDISKLGARSLK